MRKYVLIFLFAGLLTSCGNSEDKKSKPEVKIGAQSSSTEKPKETPKAVTSAEDLRDMNNKGVGVIKNVTLGDLDPALAAKGEEVFKANCTACHKTDRKFIGPAMEGVVDRRAPEWIMNMILDPELMVKEDPLARQLLIDYNGSPMANQGMTEEQARALLEYFRTL
ncbi:MAG TPA: cytochrome c [Flavobacteriaceae bacterium]|nr:cytochrome c [Flavobacteriaceae bacterium]